MAFFHAIRDKDPVGNNDPARRNEEWTNWCGTASMPDDVSPCLMRRFPRMTKLSVANTSFECERVTDNSFPSSNTVPSETHFPAAPDRVILRSVRLACLLMAAPAPAWYASGQRRLVRCRGVCRAGARREHGPSSASSRRRYADDLHDAVWSRSFRHHGGSLPASQLGLHPVREPDLCRLSDHERGCTARVEPGRVGTARFTPSRAARSQLVGHDGLDIEDERIGP